MPYLDLYKKVYKVLNKDEKIFSFVILILTFISIVLETFGIATFFPLMNAVVNENYFDNAFYEKISNTLGIDSININIFFIFFLSFFIIKSIYLVFYNYVVTYLSNKISLRITSSLFTIYLKKNLNYRLKTNTAFLVRNIKECSSLDTVLLRSLHLINEFLLIFGVIVLLMFVNPVLTLSILALIIGSLFIYNLFTKNIIKSMGEKTFLINGLYTKNLFEGLYAFKEIILFNKKSFFIERYKKYQKKTLDYQLFFTVLSSFPRALIEIILVISIVLLIYLLTNNGNSIAETVPILGVFAAAAFRLFPSVLKIYSIFQGLNHATPIINNVVKEIHPDEKEFDLDTNNNITNKQIFFENSIKLNNISFSYEEGKKLLTDINFKINKGEAVGIIGTSGSGKSTLLNIISGLLRPTKGEVIIDNVNINKNLESWREKIGYISQDFYLLDSSIAENIAFGVPKEKIDFKKIEKSIEMAELNDFILEQENGYNTIVGEKGSKISGGQKQRLSIARAIYNMPEILLLDEATSSLDKDVEDKILSTLKKLKNKFTIILISHHENPLKIVDSSYELKFNRLTKIT
jgi:ABC-type bacteriocin/lantibiotic exporter with double-glycine peptidase domain